MTLEKRYRLAVERMLNDGFDQSYVQATISDRLASFSKSIGAEAGFHRVPVQAFDDTIPGRCFDNCEHIKSIVGGEVIHGWAWHQFHDLFVVAEFHGVWRAPDGQLIDVTPPPIPRKDTVFSCDLVRVAPDIPKDDPSAAFRTAEPNRRFALKDTEDVREWICAEEANALINRRRIEGGETVSLSEFVMVIERNAKARSRLMDRLRRATRQG